MPRKAKRYPNVGSFKDRHGKLRWRWRKAGYPTFNFTAPPDTPGFAEELKLAEAGVKLSPGEGRALPRSVADLAGRYYASAGYRAASERERHRIRLILSQFVQEYAKDLVANWRWTHIEAVIALKTQKGVNAKGRAVGGATAAHSLRKQLVRLFSYAVRLEWISENPVALADRVKVPKTGGYHTWTEDEIAQYQKHHALGTTARLAAEIMLWTVQRGGDAREFGPQHMRDGKIQYRQSKTGKILWLPAAPQLLEAIRAMPKTGIRTYIVTEAGKPFSAAGFRNRMRDWCDAASLPECTAHGLRKAATRRMADAGESNQSLKAAGGWSSDSEVAIYTAAADQKRLAEGAILRLSDADLANRARKVSQSSETTD